MQEISHGYDGLRRHGVQVVHDEAVAVDAAKKTVRLARGGDIAYERLIVSPGIDFNLRRGAGLRGGDAGRAACCTPGRPGRRPWRCAASSSRCATAASYVLSVPLAPYRCPPGPYERASMVAAYFKQAKPRSKVLVLDANPDVTSKAGLFKRAWSDLYPGILEYRGNAQADRRRRQDA